tara:strand:- start:90 stop:977 length:888 start_codon:yes stop_codon:yes gene_type:complete
MSFVDSIHIEKFITSLNTSSPPKDEFLKLSNIFSINPLLDYSVNFERGILLYALVSKFKPKNILEIGTAEGFSTLCMAWAMSDSNIDGKIYTIDPKPFDLRTERIISWEENPTQKTTLLSTKELWNKCARKEWIEKIDVLTGFSGEIMKEKSSKLPKMDMGYIDGHHVYEAVLHDFYAFIKVASKNFNLLFDDYVPNTVGGGVAKVVDEEVIPNFDVTQIQTNSKQQRKEKNETESDLHMCWLHSDSLKKSLQDTFPTSKTNQIINDYNKWEKRWKLRKSLNKKIPFLGKFRFNR